MVPAAGHNFVKRFWFENAWLREPLCYHIVKDSWEICGADDVMYKIQFCREKLVDWGKEVTGNFKERLKKCKNEMQRWKLGRDEVSVANYKQGKRNLAESYVQKEVLWHQRLKQLWLQERDNNSKYFHVAATTRRRNNFVAKLKDHSGAWVDWDSGLDQLMVLKPIGEKSQAVCKLVYHHSRMLSCYFRFQMRRFAKLYLNKTNLVLIPKKNQPMDMGDLRRIALCNLLYKIVSKVVANRLKSVMPSIIYDTQSAFLQGRLISDNIMIAYEIIHHLKRKQRGRDGYMALKLDVSKAYDKLEWGYLCAMMVRMGFDGRWINLVMQCVSFVSYTFSHGGKELGNIVAQRGIRQGDPLSTYMFILCAEGFSSLLRSYEQSGLLTRCKIARGAPIISHMLFADDSYIYCKATEEKVYNVKELLHTYETASGQRINFTKSFMFYSNNIGSEVQDSICAMLEIYEADENGYYLGLPCLVERNKNAILGFLKDKLRKRIQGWLYKAKYYAHGNLFSTKLGDNPSFIWRIILEAKDLVHSCAQRTIANGENVSILADPWLPHNFNSYVVTRHPALVNKSVSCLFQVDTRAWDEDVVRDLFVSRDQDLILSIQLSDSAVNDGWNWRLETCGNYSVKSAYKFLQESKGAWCRDANIDFWKRLWSLQIPLKISNFLWRAASGVLPTCFQLQKRHVPVNVDCSLCNAHAEIVQHALVLCELAKASSYHSMVDVRAGAATFSSWLLGIFGRGHKCEMEDVAVMSWAIWRVRNEFFWQKKSWSASNIVASARKMLDQYKFAQ
ncbi:uncharacterized protein LOC133031333 [Cannabis sativa]|uniref:uncharacterized protein LOC133031333 n=1 Tax=Cannabis sativa TaxID=3483 RepID=UPI0029CA8C03|nr:uncharacterized protein LOC133031333 [Cannabis sativa]